MAVMEVNLPSGFTANTDSLPALRRYKGVKRVDTEKWICNITYLLFVLHLMNVGRDSQEYDRY